MTEGKIKYTFSGKMWQDTTPNGSGWFFVTMPKKVSKEIREHLKWQEEGWGRMKAHAKIETVKWQTAIWYDTKVQVYLLPIKAEIRNKLKLEVNKKLDISIWV